MRDPTTERLRGADPTSEGRHLHEPGGAPHALVAAIALTAFGTPALIVVVYVLAGVGIAVVVAVALAVVGLPLSIAVFHRRAKVLRAREEVDEDALEAADLTVAGVQTDRLPPTSLSR